MKGNFWKRLFLNVGASLGIIAVLVTLIFLLGVDIRNTAESVFADSSYADAKSRVAGDLSRLRDQYKAAEPVLSALTKKIPEKDSLLSFSVYIKSLAEKYNALSTLRFGEEDKEMSAVKFSIRLEGGYSSVSNFINEIDKSPYFINVLSIDIVGQSNKYNATIDGNIMFRN